MAWFRGIGLCVIVAAVLSGFPAAATVGIYNYVGLGMNCSSVQSPCVHPIADPLHLTASFTFATDFDQSYSGDQTQYAFRFNTAFVTAWSISDGIRTLSSANGDILNSDSSFTYYNGSMRTWNISAGTPSGFFSVQMAPHTDLESLGNTIALGRSVGTWSTGGGPALDSSVPEPAMWSMLVLGFGFLGSLMRRDERKRGASFSLDS